jgi:hypothetical protein
MRAEETGYVARGNDGLHFDPIVEWKFDDGRPPGLVELTCTDYEYGKPRFQTPFLRLALLVQ